MRIATAEQAALHEENTFFYLGYIVYQDPVKSYFLTPSIQNL